MATINPVESFSEAGFSAPLVALAPAPLTDLDLSTPDKLNSVISEMLFKLDRLNGLLAISDSNFQTLYGNDGNLNTAIPAPSTLVVDRGTGTLAVGPVTVTVTMNVTMADTAYAVAVTWTSDYARFNRWYVSSKTTTQFVVNVDSDEFSARSFDWVAIHL